LCINVAGLSSKMTEILNLLHAKKPLVVCLTETHITEDFQDSEISIPDYRHFVCFSNSRHTGGVIVYVRQELPSSVVKCDACVGNFWSILVKVNFNKR